MPGINALLQNRYRIERLLGEGGMGAVYLAEDEQYGRKVALKEALFDTALLRKAFKREAELLEHLNHPALPHVKGYFTEAGKQYLVMQFIDGQSLEELLLERRQNGRGPFAVEKVLQWAHQILDVLVYLHGHHPPIIHRDIKPLNLKLTPRGEVFLLDFGLAKGAVAEITQAGSLLGYTPNYAPLEQMDRTGTDPRTDIYSLAATLYRLMTGQIPPSAVARAAALMEGQPDPLRPANEVNAQVPVEVASLLEQALAQSPNQRPASAAAWQMALRQAGQSLSQDGKRDVSFDGATQLDSELQQTLIAPNPPLTLEKTLPAPTPPPVSVERQVANRSLAPNPNRQFIPSLLLLFTVGLATVIASRFLGERPDAVGISITIALGALCALPALGFVPSVRQRLESGLLQLGLKPKLLRPIRTIFALWIFAVVCGVYFLLPSVARTYNERGIRYFQARELASAIKSYQLAIRLNPDYAVAHYNLGLSYEDVQEFDQALSEYQTALVADPKLYLVYNNLARLYLKYRKNYDRALSILDDGLKLSPPEKWVQYTMHKNRGWANFELGYYGPATEDLTAALRINNEGAAAHCLLARVLEAQRKSSEARKSWESCLAYASGQSDVEASWLSLAQEQLMKEE